METQEITLKKPITIDGKERATLTMREPTVRDQIAAQKSANAALNEVQLFANLCDVPSETLQDMGLSDYKRLSDAFTHFLD